MHVNSEHDRCIIDLACCPVTYRIISALASVAYLSVNSSEWAVSAIISEALVNVYDKIAVIDLRCIVIGHLHIEEICVLLVPISQLTILFDPELRQICVYIYELNPFFKVKNAGTS